MYAYISKGMTVGHVLTRLMLREITSAPGILLDFIFAMFWIPDYTSYWAEDSASIYYADGTRHTGVMRGLFGWVGEILGFVIGAPAGMIAGAALFFPDLLFRGFLFLKKTIDDSLNDFALFIGKSSFFENINVYDEPENYSEKAWNLGSAILGMAIMFIPYTAAKTIEFFLPFLKVSPLIAEVCSAAGGLLGSILGAVLYPPIYLLNKVVDLINIGRETVFKAIALVYAKSDQNPIGPENTADEWIVPHQAVHSEAFRKQVKEYHSSTWALLIFGPLKKQAESPSNTCKPKGLNPPVTPEALGRHGAPALIASPEHTVKEKSTINRKPVTLDPSTSTVYPSLS